MANSLILNIPHSSPFIPEDEAVAFLPAARAELEKELLAMTDWYTKELFDHSIGKAVVAPVSRLVCDTERFSHDNEEPMAMRGMGFCYRTGSRNQRIKDFPDSYKDEILWRYYAPHHIALTDAVQSSLSENKRALILDCHSFSADPLPYEDQQTEDRPDICIGTDDYHTPESLSEQVRLFFEDRGYRVIFNSPYGGTIVPLRYYRKDSRVHSIMIEVNRGLYLEPGTCRKNIRFEEIRQTMLELELMLVISEYRGQRKRCLQS